MKARIAVAIAVIVLAVISLVAPSAAAVEVAGRGQLSGWGTGVARIEGAGTFYLRGSGTLTIRDLDRDADIDVHGFGFSKRLARGLRVYHGTGWVRVSGPDAMIKLEGTIDHMTVRGKGTCYMKGEGRYRIRSRTRFWRGGGVYVHFDLAG